MTRRIFGLHHTVLLLASTHFLVDGFGNVLAPLLPVIIPKMQLSLAAAGTLQMCFLIANSVTQLGFGYLADRWRPRVLLITGPLVAIAVLPLVGLASTPVMLAVVLVAGGLGGAAFHPPAAALVHRSSGTRAGLAMAVHITGGSLGFSLGPLVFAPFVQRNGLASIPVLTLPALVLLALFLRRIPTIEHVESREDARGLTSLRPYAKPLGLLYFIVVLRTLTAQCFSTFVPVMLTQQGMTVAQAGTAIALFLLGAGMGGFVGGPLADRLGARRVIILSLVASVPFLAIAPTLSGWTFVAVLAFGGFLLQSTLPVNVTFGQTIAPISAATVSSLMMGFAWGMGGVIVPFVGMMADRIGIESTLVVVSFLPLAAAILALPLPDRRELRSVMQSHAAPADDPGRSVAD